MRCIGEKLACPMPSTEPRALWGPDDLPMACNAGPYSCSAPMIPDMKPPCELPGRDSAGTPGNDETVPPAMPLNGPPIAPPKPAPPGTAPVAAPKVPVMPPAAPPAAPVAPAAAGAAELKAASVPAPAAAVPAAVAPAAKAAPVPAAAVPAAVPAAAAPASAGIAAKNATMISPRIDHREGRRAAAGRLSL